MFNILGPTKLIVVTGLLFELPCWPVDRILWGGVDLKNTLTSNGLSTSHETHNKNFKRLEHLITISDLYSMS